ncbi:GPW/gp25 family protein [[Leptolyngbya] sp. PCC 7376]|uniref:GPW/gp25 family protein n=1 Tax=[Leptolyngbya] sp. PCC 7376 TaxID=111781 RepID=UPI00029EE9E3|nr:GPW/gp25 family protein [[Leptolyngbya] sp. PCC 7376]AFY37043.1 GPW/gp25 family protein [[Leptolyngbya] sp. PCC 7376]
MDIDFLGVGWRSPLILEKGSFQTARYEAAVQQSVWMILSTAKGERVMRPTFGCGIHDRVFSPNSSGTVGEIVNDVRESLTEWEPRIDLLDVDTTADEENPNVLLIRVHYQVRTTNNIFNLVYPFYLQ